MLHMAVHIIFLILSDLTFEICHINAELVNLLLRF